MAAWAADGNLDGLIHHSHHGSNGGFNDEPATGAVALGPAELHDEIARADVAATIAELLHDGTLGRRILEARRFVASDWLIRGSRATSATSFRHRTGQLSERGAKIQGRARKP